MQRITRFLKLKRAVENLDARFITKKVTALEEHFRGRGIRFDPANTAITQEGILYIEPESGVATKVVIYIDETVTSAPDMSRANAPIEPYTDSENIAKLNPFHIMRCNALMKSQKDGWTEPYRMSKRGDAFFYYRITCIVQQKGGPVEVGHDLEEQRLFVCRNCLWKVSSLIQSAQNTKYDTFELQSFFDVNMMRSWNSRGVLSKDYGFLTDIYPEDWAEICRIRRRQMNYQCEHCFEDLSAEHLNKFLLITPVDHIEREQGYVKLECLCPLCLAEQPEYDFIRGEQAYQEYLALRGITQPTAYSSDLER